MYVYILSNVAGTPSVHFAVKNPGRFKKNHELSYGKTGRHREV